LIIPVQKKNWPEEFSYQFQEVEPINKESVHVALSGWNTPKSSLFLAENFAKRFDWSKGLFLWGDERCVLQTGTQRAITKDSWIHLHLKKYCSGLKNISAYWRK